MRIAILADPIDNQCAGIHIYTKELVRALSKFEKRNEYLLIRQKNNGDFQELEQHIIPNFPKIIAYQSLRLFVMIPYLLQKLKVDAVVEPAHFGPFNLPEKIKRITVIHDLTPIKFPQLHRFHSQLLQRIFLKKILKKADLIISNSENTRNDLCQHYKFTRDKVERIYLGKEAHFHENRKPEIISKYNLENKYFLFVGTIEPRKNLNNLLKAYEMFRNSTDKKYKLIIVGKKGWKSSSFYDAYNKHIYKDDIIILGYVSREELPVIYSNALALIFPSIYEGFGLPVLESMSCGTPCIVSDSSSLPEVGGDAALYFNAKSPEQLVERMVAIAGSQELRVELRKKSLIQANKFSWESYAMEFGKAMEKLKYI